jgi:hypothetical protein
MLCLQVVWGQFKAFVEEGWTIHVVFSKNASNILVDACTANGLEVNTLQVSTVDDHIFFLKGGFFPPLRVFPSKEVFPSPSWRAVYIGTRCICMHAEIEGLWLVFILMSMRCPSAVQPQQSCLSSLLFY